MAQIVTRVGTFDVIEKDGKTIVCKNGKALANLPDVNPWDKDAIVEAIEANGKQLSELASKTANGNITTENIVPALTHICELLNDSIEDKQVKGFVTSRLKQVINKLAA